MSLGKTEKTSKDAPPVLADLLRDESRQAKFSECWKLKRLPKTNEKERSVIDCENET